MRPLVLSLCSLAGTLAIPFAPLWLAYRSRNGREVPARLAERRGIDMTPRPDGCLLWLHAASVGETVSILAVLAALAERAPDATILVTTGTATAARLLEQREPRFGGAVLHRFIPLDVPVWVARFLDHWRPDAGAFVESELWPNLLTACRAREIPLLLLNARMSLRSFTVWRRARHSARMLLGAFNHIQARSVEDGERLRALGAKSVTTPGDLKFAATILPADPQEIDRLSLQVRPIWLAASVHPEEAETILAAHRMLVARTPGLLTIIAPRHPERAEHFVGEKPVSRRSLGEDPPAGGGIWLVDTLGELGLCYRIAKIVLIGGSLFPHGGQNLLEAARLGCTIAAGPYMHNFATACAALEQAGALTRISDAIELANWVEKMLANPQCCEASGAAAQAAAVAWLDLPGRSAATLLALIHS